MAEQGFLNYLLSQGIPINEASQYLYLAPSYPDKDYADLASTIFANHFSTQGNSVTNDGTRLNGNGPYDQPGNQSQGVTPNSYNASLVNHGGVYLGGLLGQVKPTFAAAPAPAPVSSPAAQAPSTAGVTQSTSGVTSGVTSGGGRAMGPTPVQGGQPLGSPTTWGNSGQQNTGGGGYGGANASASPFGPGAYSSPWQMGGAWSGVTSHPQYGKGLLGGATQSGQMNVMRAKDGSDNRDNFSYGNSTSNPAAGVLGGAAQGNGAFTLPAVPQYESRQFLQTYNDQPAPYANEHQQIFDAMRGVQPLVPTFANYGARRGMVREAGSAPQGGGLLGNTLSTQGNYFPGFK